MGQQYPWSCGGEQWLRQREQVGQGKLVQHSAKGRKKDLVQDGSPEGVSRAGHFW